MNEDDRDVKFIEFASTEQISEHFVKLGCRTIIAKELSVQDDSKHGIYLASRSPLTQLLPGTLTALGTSTSISKLRSEVGRTIFALDMHFTWVQGNGFESVAPATKIIEYGQYPESRLSGFLQNCAHPPSCLSGPDQSRYGTRALFIGISGEKIYATVCSQLNSPRVVHEIEDLGPWHVAPAMRLLRDEFELQNDGDQLLSQIEELVGNEYSPVVLKAAGLEPVPTKWQQQSRGWTLEALLGIPRNSSTEPDKLGYEIKAVGSSKVTLITTEPDFGMRQELGLRDFLESYGAISTSDNDKRVFNGIHAYGQLSANSNSVLEVHGWPAKASTGSLGAGPSIVLRQQGSDVILAGWSLEKLARSWAKKHSAAIYVEASKTGEKGTEKASFGPLVLMGHGTSIDLFLEQVVLGNIFLDPGDSLKGKSVKARTQWRVNGNIRSTLKGKLEPLYLDLAEFVLPRR